MSNTDLASEIDRTIKFIKQMEVIIRTSTNAAQVERVKKDMGRYQARLQELVPDYRPEKETIDQLARRIAGQTAPPPPPSVRLHDEGHPLVTGSYSASEDPVTISITDRIPEERASPHCTDPDVNFVASLLRILMREYWPAITEQHIKLDFTSSQERQALRLKIDNLVRSQKTLVETIEEYATAEKADFREQLFKMKNKQIRLYLFEANELFRDFKALLGKLIAEIQKGGTLVTNPDERLHFDPGYEEATWLENHTVREGIFEFFTLMEFAIKKINLPTMK